jgi:hypothetical protein
MLGCSVIGYCYSFEVYQVKLRSDKTRNDEEEYKGEASEADISVGDDTTEEPSAHLDDTTTGPCGRDYEIVRGCRAVTEVCPVTDTIHLLILYIYWYVYSTALLH